MTINEAIQNVLEIARAEIGYHEKSSNAYVDDKTTNAGSANYTKYARDLDAIPNFYNGKKNGYAWCDMFHDWLHVKAWGAELAMQVLCQPVGSAGAGCSYSAQYYKNSGRWYTSPQAGDQIFFFVGGAIGHTGVVESVSGGIVTTIEGNTADSVARRKYDIGNPSIAGYGRPNYELVCGIDAPTENHVNVEYANNKYNLHFGLVGDYIKELQEALIKLGYSCGDCGADGEFGADTLNALVDFQEENGLEADGIAGRKTWDKIEAMVNGLSVSAAQRQNAQTYPMLKYGAKNDTVAVLQKKLIALGFSCGDEGADGVFGKNTLAAVLRFQKSRSIEVDGICGPITWAALERGVGL